MVDRAGNNRRTARRISVGIRPRTFVDAVGTGDRNDYYRVQFGRRTSLDLTMFGMRRNANVELLRFNGRRIRRSARLGRRNENINVTLNRGTYFIRVYQRSGNTNYRLRLTANPDFAGNNLAQARPIAAGARLRQYRDYVAQSDTNDSYRFRLGREKDVDLRLFGMTANADLRLLDGNGRLLQASIRAGRTPERIRTRLDAGTYYLRVTPRRPAATRYVLRALAVNPPAPSETLTESWITQFGSPQNDYAYGIALDSDRNIYVGGTTGGTLPGQQSAGGDDAILGLLDNSGNLLDVAQMGTSAADTFSGVAIASDDTVYATGFSNVAAPRLGLPPFLGSGNVVLASYTNTNNQLTLLDEETVSPGNINAGADVAIAPDDTPIVAGATVSVGITGASSRPILANLVDGNLQSFSGDFDRVPTQSAVTSLAIDGDGNIYLTGVTNATLNTGDLSNPLTNGNVFIAKYDASGNELWFDTLSSNASDTARRLAIDAAGNVYVVGQTEGTLPGQTSKGGVDAFIAKYSKTGDRTWLKQIGTPELDEAQSVAVDNEGNVYVTGETEGSLFGNNLGGSDAFIVKYTAAGNEVVNTQMGTANNDETYGITVDANQNVYVVGQTQGAFTDNTNAGSYDIWVAKYLKGFA
jgi:hypothetical protein